MSLGRIDFEVFIVVSTVDRRLQELQRFRDFIQGIVLIGYVFTAKMVYL